MTDLLSCFLCENKLESKECGQDLCVEGLYFLVWHVLHLSQDCRQEGSTATAVRVNSHLKL